jgi:hypothetical protein
MTATFLLGALLGVVILMRHMRWIAVIVVLIAAGYFAYGRIDFWPHEDRPDHTIILRP